VIVRYYLDAAPVIYAVEEVPLYAAAVDKLLSAADVVRVASDLTRMECRVKPIRDHNDALLADFDEYFEETVDEIISLSRDIIDHATNIRAQYGFKSPDAIHLAAAVASGCDVFLTNDRRLDRFKDLTVDVVRA
jgi:uncharacterized protein